MGRASVPRRSALRPSRIGEALHWLRGQRRPFIVMEDLGSGDGSASQVLEGKDPEAAQQALLDYAVTLGGPNLRRRWGVESEGSPTLNLSSPAGLSSGCRMTPRPGTGGAVERIIRESVRLRDPQPSHSM